MKRETINLVIYTDGACRGNHQKQSRGKMASAFVIYQCLATQDKKLYFKYQWNKALGPGTNNQAEYHAIIAALSCVAETMKNDNRAFVVTLYSDSLLIINQINNVFHCNSPTLKECLKRVNRLWKNFENLSFGHIRRTNEYIALADKLCNKALDEQVENYSK